MSQSRRFGRFGLIVASGLFALISFVPGGAVAASSDSTGTHETSIAKGDGPWCC